MRKILLIQTAFIGDVILATALIEALSAEYPNAEISFLLRKGNETLLHNNPHVRHIFIWDKNEKIGSFVENLKLIRKEEFDLTINIQRFLFSGLFTVFSGAKKTIGFDKNPLSFLFSTKVKHSIGNGKHEIERNFELVRDLTPTIRLCKPKLYPKSASVPQGEYITISPSSVWFTKQFPLEKWIEFSNSVDTSLKIYVLGGKGDIAFCNEIKAKTTHQNMEVLAGKMSFLESAELMKYAKMNYVNDSAPLHICSAVNAPVTAIFCSTVPEFGFTPLSDNSNIVQIEEKLECRPCGLHGKKACPKGHFNCGFGVNISTLLKVLNG